ncbi:MAG: TonB-dependent receptor plug domain-containing protein [Bacteroidia bacterium]
MRVTIKLSEGKHLNAVDIVEDKTIEVHDDIRTSTINIQIDKIKTQPVLLGEQDLIKTIQMLPGVQGGTEGLTGMYVRGGGPDQNLILLDGVPLYNVSHMLGIFSVFNPGAIESAELIKGGFPARYGGRLSSVLDITTKQGNMQKWEGEGSVGIMSARMSANGPLQKGKTSLSVSGRRSYYDLMIKPFISAYTAAQDYEDITVGYFFNDINVRLDHKLNDKQTLTFNGFLVRDKFYIDYKREWDGFNDYNQSYNKGVDDYNAGVSWGTALAQTVLKTKVNDHLVNTTSVYYNRYRFLTKYSLEDYYYVRDSLGQEYESASSINLAYRTYINDIAAKTEFQKKISHSANLRYGGIMNFQMFQPAASIYELNEVLREDEIDTLFKGNTRYSQQIQSYIEFEKEFGYRFKVNLGAHLNVFRQNDYLSGSLQPRVMGLMHLNDWSSLKVSYAMMQQNLHLLTNPSIGLPTDLWVPATKNAPSEISHQLAFGYAATLPKNMSLTLEGYYKTMSNVIEYAEAELFLGIGDDWEETIAIGNGNAYGIEFLLQKSKGKFTGWIGYTLSFTNRQFDDLNNGEQFPYRYDRRHDIGITLHYQKSEKFDIGLNWVYGTGYAFSLSHGSSFSPNYLNWGYNQNYETIEFTARNNYRVPSYHRLDLGFNWHKKKKWGKRTWQLGFYNTYNRMNPFAVFWNFEFGYDSNITPDNNKLKVLTLLPIIPSFTYQFKF